MKLLSGERANICAVFVCAVKASIFVSAISIATLFSQSSDASAKGPGVRYCFHSTCHRVLTLAQTRARVGKSEILVASYYDDCKRDAYNPCGLTSSGEPFFSGRHDNAASPIYPDGTILLLWNPETKKSAVVRINNAGPYWGNRKLDVSRAVAEKLGFFGRGIGKLKVEVISAPNKAEATYKRNRRYAPVAGYIGVHETFENARLATAAVAAVNALAASTLALPVGAVVSVARTEKTQERWKKHAKSTDRQKSSVRDRLIRLAADDRLTRMARVSDVVPTLSNRPMPTLANAVAKAVPYNSDIELAKPISAKASAIKVASADNSLAVIAVPVAKATARVAVNVKSVVGRRGTVTVAQVSDARTVVSKAPLPPKRRVASWNVRRDFAAIASEIQVLRTSDLVQIVRGHPTGRVLAMRDLFSLPTQAELEAMAEKRMQDEDNSPPGPKREVPELPKKFARADTNSSELHSI